MILLKFTLNSDGYLEEYFVLLNPESHTINKENESDSEANGIVCKKILLP